MGNAAGTTTDRDGAEVVRVLLDEGGASIRAVTPQGWTVFHSAASGGDVRIMGLLLDRLSEGGDEPFLDLADEDGLTPLLVACSFGHKDTVHALMTAGADATSVDA